MTQIKNTHSFFTSTLPNLGREIYDVCYMLFKLMIPVIIIVKLLEEFGAIPVISAALEPLMQLVGLPDTMGLVVTTTMLTNIYGGMLIFFQTAGQESLTVAQITVLSSMLLIAHSLPIELRIVQQAGVRFLVALSIRLISALLLGMILHHVYSWGGWLQQPAELIWTPAVTDNSLLSWTLAQLESFAMIILVISALLSLLRFLRWIHVERAMIWLLRPVLRLLGIGPQATSLTIIGVTLGLSFGGGLLIKEAQSGHISPRDCFSALCLLSLCHSMIEDTLLVLTMGADLSGVLWARLLFGLLFVAIMTRWLNNTSDKFQQRYLMHVVTPSQAPEENIKGRSSAA
ncbi:MAG: hypothetical protein V7731_23305 [Amphritea sp.]